jgi:chromosome segregation ATPase
MSVRSTPASALRQPHFSATPWTERSAAGVAATPAERRLTAQVARAESTLRDVRDELEERTRLLARTKQSIESLQQDLQRARDSEVSSRALARERQDADTRRIAELERQLAETKGDETHNDVSRRALVDRLASLERALEDRELERVRLEGELALREATAETLREDAEKAARTIDAQRIAIEEARETLEANERAHKLVAAERAERAETVRELVASAAELRSTERSLREENETLKAALRRAAEKHEEAMAMFSRGAATQKSLTTTARGDEGKDEKEKQDALASRLAKLQTDVKALAEREIRVLARQTAMTEEMDALRGALESERARRVAAEARTRALEREKNAPTSGTVGTPEEASPPSSR